MDIMIGEVQQFLNLKIMQKRFYFIH